MNTSEVFNEQGDIPVLEPMEENRTKTMSLEEAFPSDREPTVDELNALPETLSHAPADFYKKIRAVGPYFTACLLLAYYAKAVGGEVKKVLPEDLTERLQQVFREDDNLDKYVKKAYLWYARQSEATK